NLLARVHNRLFAHENGQVRVNLADVVADEQPELLPLRRWARGRLAAGGSADVRFDRTTLEQLAARCGLRTEELLTRLTKLPAAGSADVRFDRTTLDQLAALCGLRTEDLLTRLKKLPAAAL